jgi:hypothetical protein
MDKVLARATVLEALGEKLDRRYLRDQTEALGITDRVRAFVGI